MGCDGPSAYSEKFVVSGNVFEYYKYARLIQTGFKGNFGRKKGTSMGGYREEVLRRSRKTVRRLINTNMNMWHFEDCSVTTKFLTLTFRANVSDLKAANAEFKNFVKRLNYFTDVKIKYVVVPEFQKRGAVHYHCVLFNMPYVKAVELAHIWRHGSIKVNKIDKVDNLGAYVCKYMTKSDDVRMYGQKLFFTSRCLLHPENVTDYEDVQRLKSTLADKKVFEFDFDARFLGAVHYEQYNLDKRGGAGA